MATVLHLNLKAEYFEEIKNKTKIYEYRLITPYWTKRLVDRGYDEVHIKKGYPKANDSSRIIKMEYKGYTTKMIRHKHFGDNEVEVYAIRLTGKVLK